MITSVTNGRIKQVIALRERSRLRNKEGLFVAEGVKMFEEAPISGLQEVYCSSAFWSQLQNEGSGHAQNRYGRIWDKLQQCIEQKVFVEQVSDEVFKKASDTQTPQGILFVMKQLSWSLNVIIKKALDRKIAGEGSPLFLILEDIQDPGNLGTMVRTAEGAGLDGIIMSRGTVDIYNPKTIRSTMGSLYRVPFLYSENLLKDIETLKKNQITVYAAHLKGKQFYDETEYAEGSAFLIGNEGNGLSEEVSASADCLLKIPMEGKLESLNAAVAAALLMYRAAGDKRKQRRLG